MKNKLCILVCLIFAPILSCGGSAPSQDTTPGIDIPNNGTPLNTGDTHATEAAEASAKPEPQPITAVTRAELDAIINKGPGYALGTVQTDPVKANGKFVGYQIIGFRLDAPAVLGIQPGDIVHHINGISIEKPMALVDIFEKLKTAPTLEFALIRNGKEITLSTPVQ
ncbi:MAG: hypothetical protein JXX14_07395 [Deltaproteobacteria bacterium]|nr:hypothetical protein [Deltaproteobacteria bacterium]